MTEADTPETLKSHLSPGAALSQARRTRQMSQNDVAGRLKLPRTTIEHIESDRFERIAPIYRRGYIVNYARLFDLDPQPLLEQMGALEPEPLRSVLPRAGNPQRFERFFKFATYALVTTMIVPPLVYFFVLGGARLFESEVVSRSIDSVGEQSLEAQKPGYRERFADALAVQPPETTRNDSSHLSASALPMNPIRSAVQAEPVVDAAPQDADDDVDESASIDSVTQLEIVLKEDSWVEIESADGQRLEFDLLRSGEVKTYSGRAPFKLLVGRASAVSVTLDGERVAFDGQDQAGVAELLLGEPTSNVSPPEAGPSSAD